MEEENNLSVAGEIILAWEAPEYFHHQKNTDWYWWVGLFAVVLLGFAVWQRSFLFGALILIGWFTIVLYAARAPRVIGIAVTERGIAVENKLYLWHELKSFWIFYNPPLVKEISLESKRGAIPYIKLPLGDENPTKVRETVAKFIPEVEQPESLIDNLSHLARF